MYRPKGYGLRRLCLKTGLDFSHVGLVWFPQGTTGVYKYQLSFQFQMNKIMWEIQNGFQEIFLPGSNLSNDRHYFCLCQV